MKQVEVLSIQRQQPGVRIKQQIHIMIQVQQQRQHLIQVEVRIIKQ